MFPGPCPGGTGLWGCSLAWCGQLGVSHWEQLCLLPATGCKHSGDVAPPPGCWGKRPQQSRQWAFRQFICAPDLETDSTYFCPGKVGTHHPPPQPGHLDEGGSSSDPTLSPTCFHLIFQSLLHPDYWAGRSSAPGFQADTGPGYWPYHTP